LENDEVIADVENNSFESEETKSDTDDTIVLQPNREKHLLIGLYSRGMLGVGEEPLEELAALVDTAGADVVGKLWQKRNRPHSRTYLGKGKLAELVEMVNEIKPHTVVADSDLSPRQLKALEEAVQTKVIDRSEVILDIFATRARTHQARLQVSLAQLQYEMPRLGRKWTHLERLGGGIGTRGPGESQIETDRRLLRSRISRLKNELDSIEKRKQQEVGGRAKEFTVSLVGYTNAGKSTLMNTLTNAGTFAEDKLFATLDTLTRTLDLGGGMKILLSDTVGFIRRLPHHLVASFHATLEETTQAKLLFHVVDASSPIAVSQIRSVNETLSSIDLQGREHVYILNKVDMVKDEALFQMLKEKYTPNICLSAKTGEGVEELLDFLREKAIDFGGRKKVTLKFHVGDGKRLAAINEYGDVADIRYEGESVLSAVELSEVDIERLKRLPGEMDIIE
jgi:GTP-binding protein HflX